MKKLLLISFLTFFSISAIAETSLRCKFYKACEDSKCSNDVNEAYVQLVYEESWLFGNKIVYKDIDYTPYAKFYDHHIEFGFTESSKKTYYKKTKILITRYRHNKKQKSQNMFIFGHKTYTTSSSEFICTEIN